MAKTSARRKPSQRTALSTGPWPGVRDTTDPYDDADADVLVSAQNGYIPDPEGRSGCYARPGWSLLNSGTALVVSGTPFRGQAVYSHTALSGTTYNFFVIAGRLIRVDATLSTFTDVTPGTITIDAAITTRVKFLTQADNLIVSDGVNPPWLATNLASTPITGTAIDYDGIGTTWAATDITVWGGSLVCALAQVNNVSRRDDIAWSEPGLPAIGYQQTGYSNNWTIEQTGTNSLIGLVGTNIALYYFRQRSIGSISGAIGPNLATTSTHDAIAFNVGLIAPQTVQLFGNVIFFCDVIGRPWMLPLGGPPQPIWKNLRAVVDSATTGFPVITAAVATSAFEVTLNKYLVAIWSPAPSQQAQPTQIHSFDAQTGNYEGYWTIDVGFSIDCIGTLTDSSGRAVLIALGSKTVGGTNGYAWALNSLLGTPDFLTTEAGTFLTTEDGTSLTSEGQALVWTDNGVVPPIVFTTQRLGYSEEFVWNADRATAITTNNAPVQISVVTPSMASTVEATPTPTSSQDGTFRAVGGFDAVQGRGLQVTVSPTTATSQWSLQRIVIDAVPSLAGVEEP